MWIMWVSWQALILLLWLKLIQALWKTACPLYILVVFHISVIIHINNKMIHTSLVYNGTLIKEVGDDRDGEMGSYQVPKG